MELMRWQWTSEQPGELPKGRIQWSLSTKKTSTWTTLTSVMAKRSWSLMLALWWSMVVGKQHLLDLPCISSLSQIRFCWEERVGEDGFAALHLFRVARDPWPSDKLTCGAGGGGWQQVSAPLSLSLQCSLLPSCLWSTCTSGAPFWPCLRAT